MQIQDVENLAELAKLKLKKKKKTRLLSDMESILAYVKQIENIEIPEGFEANSENGIDEPYYVKNVWREDGVYERDFSQDLIAKQYPKSKDGFVKVKKIL